MYRLLSPVPGGLDKLIQEVEDHIKQVGLDSVKGLKGENVCTQKFIQHNIVFY